MSSKCVMLLVFASSVKARKHFRVFLQILAASASNSLLLSKLARFRFITIMFSAAAAVYPDMMVGCMMCLQLRPEQGLASPNLGLPGIASNCNVMVNM